MVNQLKQYKKYIFYLLLTFFIVYFSLLFISFIMKDRANNDWCKRICHEFFYGSKNMIALMINNIRPGTIEYNSVFVPVEEPHKISLQEQSIKDLLSRYVNQKEIDKKLMSEYESGEYTLDEPFVIINPYGNSPLTALVIFDTQEECLVKVKINGHIRSDDIDFTFYKQGFCKKHIIPIYGLYAGIENRITITLYSGGGQVAEREILIKTDSLSESLEAANLHTYKSDMYNNNNDKYFNFSYMSVDLRGIKYAFDMDGNIRWFFNDTSLSLGTNYDDGKSVYRTFGNSDYGDCIITQENYLGKILKMYYCASGVHHDVHVIGDKMFLTSNYISSSQDMGICMSLQDGKVLDEIDYRKLLPRARYVGNVHSNIFDWVHINSITDYKDGYISSSNYQSAILCHSRNNKLKWVLSDPQEYPTYWKKYLLTPIGADFEYPYNQHAVEVLPDYDDNDDTVDILLFDNGTSRNVMNGNKDSEHKLYSRLVHYRINEKNMTVEQIWQYGKERPEIFAAARGDADLLQNGNVLGTFPLDPGLIEPLARKFYFLPTYYCEVNRDGDLLWECYATSNTQTNQYMDYRLERNMIYNDENDYLDLFLEPRNFVPNEIMKKYGY